MKKRLLLLVCFFTFGILLTIASAKDGVLEKVSLQLSWKNQFQFAGYYIAKEKGFYQDAGLDVDIKEYEPGINVTRDVLNRKVNFGVGRSALVIDKMQGKDVFMLAAIFQQSPLMLLARDRNDLKDIRSLKHKKIMFSDDAVSMASLTAMLKANGISGNEVEIQKHTFNIEDLIAGKTDALAAYVSNEPFQMAKKRIPYKIFHPKDYGFNFYGDILFTSQKLHKTTPQLTNQFYQASMKGWEYAFSHIEETIDLILQKYNTQNRTQEALLFEAKTLKKLAYKKNTPFGTIHPERIHQIAQVYRLLGITESFGNLNNLIYQPGHLNDIGLTPEEKLFLARHPVIRVHNESGWAPYNFFENGKPRGFSIDYMKLLAQKLGIKIEFISGPSWGEFIEQIKEKKLDVMLNIARSPERQKFLNFSNGYFDLAMALFIRDDMEPIHSIKELYGKRFAIPKGFYFEETMQEYPQVELIGVKDTAESIQAVAFDRADALLDLIPVVRYYQRKLLIDNIKLGGTLDLNEGRPIPLHLGVRKDWPLLTSIFNKAMQEISDEEVQKIKNRWFDLTGLNANQPIVEIKKKLLRFTPKELAWLKAHPSIRLGVDKAYPPFEFIGKDGRYKGISMEYVRLISDMLNINIEVVPNLTWSQILKGAENRSVDIISAISKNKKRETYLNFTEPYVEYPHVIITQQDYPRVSGLEDFEGKRFAFVKDYSSTGRCQETCRLNHF